MTFPLPYALMVSDGLSMRTIHPAAMGKHRAAIEAALFEMTGLARKGEGVSLLVLPAALPTLPGALPKPPAPPIKTDTMTQGEIARAKGYTGDCCQDCGNFTMLRNGSCLKCDSCGGTTGCS